MVIRAKRKELFQGKALTEKQQENTKKNLQEMESRAEIQYEAYAKAINIEARTMMDIAGKQIIPAVIGYTKSLAETVIAVKEAGADASTQTDLLRTVSEKLSAMKSALERLKEAEMEAGKITNAREQAFYYKDVVKVIMEELRAPTDEAEMLVDKKVWPIPTYGDLIFEI